MIDNDLSSRLRVSNESLESFCRRWRVTELAVFGSALRDDFNPDSDIDLLVTFESDAPWSLFDIVTMKNDAESLFGRRVDVVERQAVESHHNPWKRSMILRSQRLIYTAA